MTFDPSSLAGKVLWLRAKDNAGADASSITTWADQSGLSHDGAAAGTSPTVATASTPLGGKSVRFGGAGYFTLPTLIQPAASASSELDPTLYPASNAIDGNTSTFWHSASGLPAWLSVMLATAYAATSYTMTPRGTTSTRDPKDFTFQGSNDRQSWTVLDTQVGQVSWGTTPRTFSFSNSTAYLYYRLNVTAVNGDTYTQLAELAIPGSTYATTSRGEIWAVIKSDSDANYHGVWKFGTSATASFYPAGTADSGYLFDDFGSTTRTAEGAPVLAVTSWRIYRIAAGASAWLATVDGTTQISASATVPSWNLAPTVGVSGAYYTAGNIAEILVRSQVSTTQEVIDITAYLTAEHFTAVTGAALTAASTLTITAADTVLPSVALVAASSLTAVTSVVLSGAASLVATSSLTPTMAPATVVSLSAASSLVADAATPVTAVVVLSATSMLTTAGTVVATGSVALGAVTVAAGPAVAFAAAQPGTLANPYAATDSATRSLDFTSALFVATEPVAITGPPAAPSIWYEFTESQVADLLASTSGFANGAVIELYSGPPGAGPDDLTFIATDGSSLVTLGAVTLSALVTTIATSLRAELVDLGAVAVAASPAVAVVLS